MQCIVFDCESTERTCSKLCKEDNPQGGALYDALVTCMEACPVCGDVLPE